MSKPASFFKERLSGIGGSDIGDLFSLEPHGCARRLWYEKRGVEPDVIEVETGAMRRGTRLEDVAAEEYSLATGRKLRRISLQRHKEHQFLIVHADRSIVSCNGRGPGILEVKVPGFWMFKKITKEGLPEAYVLQVQAALNITGRAWGSYCIFNADTWTLLHWDVERDEEICRQIDLAGAEFWKRVENGPAPDRLEPTDRRCQACAWRTQCQGEALLKAVKDLPPSDQIPEDDSLAGLSGEYVEAKAIAVEAGALLDQLKERLKEALGARQLVKIDGQLYHYKPVESNRIDVKLLRAKLPKIATKYETKGISRPLKNYPI